MSGGHEHHGHAHLRHGHSHADGGAQPTVYVLQRRVDFSRCEGEATVTIVAAFLTRFIHALAAAGCTLIGHVKGSVEDDAGARLYFNATSFRRAPAMRGAVSAALGTLTLYAVVYGVSEAEVERAALEAADGGLNDCSSR